MTAPEDSGDLLTRVLAILEKQIEDSGTLQRFVLGLAERLDTLTEASARHDAELRELSSELAQLEKRLKKAKKK